MLQVFGVQHVGAGLQGGGDDQAVVEAVVCFSLQIKPGVQQLGAGGHAVQGLHGRVYELLALFGGEALREFSR